MTAKVTREDHWFAIIDQEEGENAVTQIIDEVVKKAQDVVFEKHIESQVLPYAVNFAKDAILSIIEVGANGPVGVMTTNAVVVGVFQTRSGLYSARYLASEQRYTFFPLMSQARVI
jgi:hypothetical protein